MWIWMTTATPAPTVGVREVTLSELRNIPLSFAVLFGVLAVVCGCLLLYFAWKKRKKGKTADKEQE